MVAQITQAVVYALGGATTSGTVQVTQSATYGLASAPATSVRIFQSSSYALANSEGGGMLQLTQAAVYALTTQIPEDAHRVRAWTFSLDGHDFYVLRLGTRDTLIYDLTTGQWAQWEDHDHNYWRAHSGVNWLGMGAVTYERGFGSNVVAGDSIVGQLWGLDPLQGYDDTPDGSSPTPFTRKVVGGLPQEYGSTTRCNAIYLSASKGQPTSLGTDVTLRTSDNLGRSWQSHGSVTTTLDNFDQEFMWRSLGLIRAPGRIFEVTDNGAIFRIAGLEIR